jgi:hypothetical protein
MAPHGDLPLLPGPVWTLLWFRLERLGNRLARLHERWRTNTLPTPRPKTTTRPNSVRKPPPQIPEFPAAAGTKLVDAPTRLPRGRGWIVKRIPDSGPSAGALHDLLQQADTRTFIEAAPQAARLLRPLCHALGLDQPEWLKLPPRPRPPRKPRTPRPRPARPLPLTHPDLGLQPYVIRAARYFIKKYGRDG